MPRFANIFALLSALPLSQSIASSESVDTQAEYASMKEAILAFEKTILPPDELERVHISISPVSMSRVHQRDALQQIDVSFRVYDEKLSECLPTQRSQRYYARVGRAEGGRWRVSEVVDLGISADDPENIWRFDFDHQMSGRPSSSAEIMPKSLEERSQKVYPISTKSMTPEQLEACKDEQSALEAAAACQSNAATQCD